MEFRYKEELMIFTVFINKKNLKFEATFLDVNDFIYLKFLSFIKIYRR